MMTKILNSNFSYYLQAKGSGINNLLLNVTQILNELENEQRLDIDNKVDSLHSHWTEVKDIVENRLDLATLFLNFLKLADSISNMFDYFEKSLNEMPQDEQLKQLDSAWGKIKSAFHQLKLDGTQFIDETRKVFIFPFF